MLVELLDVAADHIPRLLVVRDLAERLAAQSVVGSPLLDRLGLQADQSNTVRLALAVDDDLTGVRADRFEVRRNRRRSNIFTLRGLEHVLLAIGDPQEALGVKFADIAGVEPALGINRLGGCLRQVVVAVHHAGTFQKDLTVLGDLDLGLGQRPPDGAETVGVGPVDRGGSRGLGEPVTLQHDDTDGVEPLRDLAVKRGRPGNEEPHPATEPIPDGGQHQPVGQRVLDRKQR